MRHENKKYIFLSVCEHTHACVCASEGSGGALYMCVHGKATAVSLAPFPLSQRTVKSEIKRFTIMKQFCQIRPPLL